MKQAEQILIAIIVIVMNAHYAMNRAIWGEQKEALDMAIKALEQKPCEDCVSRAEAINGLQKICDECDSEFCGDCRIDTEGTSLDSAKEMLKNLPSVTPTRTETVTEFAGRCRECGKTAIIRTENDEILNEVWHLMQSATEEDGEGRDKNL